MKHFLLILAAATSIFCSVQAAPIKGDAVKGKAIATTVCSVCHAADGNSIGPPYPKLAGQHADYLYKQMKEFKAAGGKPAERVNSTMTIMIAAYDEAQVRDLATYFASQKLVGSQVKIADNKKLGEKIYSMGNVANGLPACAACHGPTGAGIPNQFPRIGGQVPEYVEIQLKAFHSETRTNDYNRMMRMVAAKMSESEIKAVANYVGSMR